MRRLLAIAFVALATGCGAWNSSSSGITVPGGPQAAQFGLTPRCQPGDSTCTDLALATVDEILGNLGAPLPPAPGAPPGPQVNFRFTIQVDRDPAWAWRSADGSGGTTGNAMIELEPYLAGRGDALVRIAGNDAAYPIPPELAQPLVDALFFSDV